MTQNELFGVMSIILAFAGYIAYFRSIFNGITKPHAFSWFVWTVVCFITAGIQYAEGAGPGMWAMVFTGSVCFVITIIGVIQGFQDVDKKDVFALIIAFTALALWLLTDNPLLAMILITIVDAVAFYPTFRKSWHLPYSEDLVVYYTGTVKLAMSLIAMNVMTIAGSLSLWVFIVLNIFFILMCYYRRLVMYRPTSA